MKNVAALCCLVLAAQLVTAQAVPTGESDALMALFKTTNGDGWANSLNWGNIGEECSWYGVSCTGSNITGLELDANGLAGQLPVEIGQLPALQVLSLHSNQLSGPIPAEIGKLRRLLALDLHSNQLSGPIPAEIGELTDLHVIGLAANKLSGSIPPEIGNLTDLRSLNLYKNELSGSIPAEIQGLTSLTSINLGSNQLSGSIPPEIGSLAELQMLYLHENQLSGRIPAEIGQLGRLQFFTLTNNQLDGPIPPEIGNLTRLQLLCLESNQLGGPIPPEIGNLGYIKGLYLEENRLSGPIPPEIGNLGSLMVLNLRSNRLSGAIPEEVANLSALYSTNGLDLRWNALHLESPSLLDFLASRQYGGDWQSTQTVAPGNLSVASVSDHTVWLEWTAIPYTSNRGWYELLFATTGTIEPANSAGTTASKSDTVFPVTGLQPGQVLDLTVRTVTLPHSLNTNTVTSEFSAPVMATTSDQGCTAPEISVSEGGPPFTLSVTTPHLGYEWSTGETTASIVVSPHWQTTYWVRTVDPDGCEEGASVHFDLLVADDLESGDLLFWSAVVVDLP